MKALARGCLGVAVAAAASAGNVAYACAACFSPLEENRQAFVDTTIFLTVVPLMMIGGLVWWIRRKTRAMDQAVEIPLPETLLHDVGRFSKDG